MAAGRNLAVLLEAAVRNTILQLRGIDSMGLHRDNNASCLTRMLDSQILHRHSTLTWEKP